VGLRRGAGEVGGAGRGRLPLGRVRRTAGRRRLWRRRGARFRDAGELDVRDASGPGRGLDARALRRAGARAVRRDDGLLRRPLQVRSRRQAVARSRAVPVRADGLSRLLRLRAPPWYGGARLDSDLVAVRGVMDVRSAPRPPRPARVTFSLGRRGMIRYHCRMRIFLPVLVAGLTALGCTKKSDGGNKAAAATTPEFDQKWSSLADKDVEVFYIEDDRGEGLMGNVRRAKRGSNDALNAKVDDSSGTPATLSNDAVQKVIRQNLAGVRACFLRIGRDGDQRSGKAIVSFEIGAAGDVHDTKVDAPAFQGTSLPGCVLGMVSHWVFPKSQKGGLAISYPFVFVGG